MRSKALCRPPGSHDTIYSNLGTRETVTAKQGRRPRTEQKGNKKDDDQAFRMRPLGQKARVRAEALRYQND